MNEPKEKDPVPSGQRWFDNIWLLFLLSLIISGLIYNRQFGKIESSLTTAIAQCP